MMPRDGIAVKHRGRHRHYLGLELGGTRIHVALQHVDVREQAERLGQKSVVVVVAVVDRPRNSTAIGDAILLTGHGRELLEDAGTVPAFG